MVICGEIRSLEFARFGDKEWNKVKTEESIRRPKLIEKESGAKCGLQNHQKMVMQLKPNDSFSFF
uniref:Uncharacterized protein n=1 Tax=Daucus carota subsp. sativus TaxID=79200 RepID=A0A164SVQ0_DAUCS